MLLTVPKQERAEVGKWGESKRRVQIMLTPTATEKIDAVADQMGITRSELLELLIRTSCLDAEVLKRVDAGIQVSEKKSLSEEGDRLPAGGAR